MSEVILALDVATAESAEAMLDRIPEVRWVKVGSILMTREGGGLVRRLAARGLRVFLDLKWHDIPNTVAGAVSQARDLGAAMATVHALGGRRMLEAAAQAAGDGLQLVGVTVLTSHDASGYAELAGREAVSLDDEARRLAVMARQCGLAGVVCSPAETALLRQALGPDATIVVPGIRMGTERTDDQKRVATPAAAARAGATHLVVGRPVLEAADPCQAFAEITRQVLAP